MARALCEARHSDRVESLCAGVFPAPAIHRDVLQSLADIGVAPPSAAPVGLSDLEADGGDLCAFDLIVALSETARDGVLRAISGGAVALEYWPTEDPMRAPDRIAAVRDALIVRIDARFGEAGADAFIDLVD